MWYFNCWFLQDDKFVELLYNEINTFLGLDEDSVDSAGTLFEMLKAFMRAVARSYLPGAARKLLKCITDLEAAILLRKHSDPRMLTESEKHQLELDRASLHQLIVDEAHKCWIASASQVYKYRVKFSKLLHWLTTCHSEPLIVPRVQDALGQWVKGLQQIATLVAHVYESLDTSKAGLASELDSP
ncbi:hypothetical protein NDU88_006366 [Pleurodeles waltl]|uniref:Uncharacterized protein n=1 Tax=Pleurodeles waltl TaxID=8319 RepID=A0AAV7RPB7_PLEWA|nr:hypothetical protein NDU88_006366 [Pleurodeles waltl]